MLAGAIHRAQVYDRALAPAEVAASAGVENTFVSESQIVARLGPDQQARRTQLRAELAQMRGQLRRAKATS